MDIKEKVSEVVEKIKKDPKLLAEFKDEPVKTVEKILGVDLPDGLVEKVIDSLKDTDIKDIDLGNLGGALKKLF